MAEQRTGWRNPFLSAPPSNDPHLLTAEEMVSLSKAPRRPPGGSATFDYRGADTPSRVQLSEHQPGDIIRVPGADVRLGWDGSPDVHLKPGFEDGRSAGARGPVLVPPGPANASVAANEEQASQHTPFWFLNQVPNRRPWDYKQKDRSFEAFGNFNYGAAGRSARLPAWVLERGAGWAQQQAGTSRPEYGSPYLGTKSYGDDPVDQYWIGEGVRYHDTP